SLDHLDANRLTVRDDVLRLGYRSWERPRHQPRAHSRMPFGMREDGQVMHSNEPGRPTVVRRQEVVETVEHVHRPGQSIDRERIGTCEEAEPGQHANGEGW